MMGVGVESCAVPMVVAMLACRELSPIPSVDI